MNIILDVETMDMKYNFICDIAWAIVDRNKVKKIKNYVVRDYLEEMAVGNFSGPKMPATLKEVADGNAEIKTYVEIMRILAKDMKEAKNVYAYNAPFDRSKIIATAKALQLTDCAEFFEAEEMFNKWRDLWSWSTNTILYKKSFLDFCEVHGLNTASGKFYSTSAETCLKYLNNDINYVEAHTARQDVMDEFKIYLAIKKEIKKEMVDICGEDERGFKGSPTYNIKRFRDAINS